MATNKSTRLAIVEQSIEDMLERLDALPLNPRVRELRSKVKIYERAVQMWPTNPPTEAQRSAMLKNVIELHVEVMQLGREGTVA
jgi:hypothetical protein